MLSLTDPIEKIKGIGPKKAESLKKAGIFDINSLLHFFPRTYSSMPEKKSIKVLKTMQAAGRVVTEGTVLSTPQIFKSGRGNVLSFLIGDLGESLRVYIFGMPYLKKNFPQGRRLLLLGNLGNKGKELILNQPRILTKEEYESAQGRLDAVYPHIKDLNDKTIWTAVKSCLHVAADIKEYLPEETVHKEGLCSISDAIIKMHCPESIEDVALARRRLAFDEFFLFLSKIHFLKKAGDRPANHFAIQKGDGGSSQTVKAFIEKLPYDLTGAQKRALEDILSDMEGSYAANRLIQGDVGSGKTIIAFAAALAQVSHGRQALIMAPTEVLAAQHYKDIEKLTEEYGLPFRAALLSGSLKASEKKAVKERLKTGDVNILIGTHAVIEDDVEFKELSLVITDEQHRFGVGQRMKAMQKGGTPHTVVMSATPIPRTLGLIIYGDMDVSIVDEMPAKRLERKNAVVDISYKEKALKMIIKHIRDGEQAYIICPMVEASEDEDIAAAGNEEAGIPLANVTDLTVTLKEILPPDIRIDMLHGRLKPKEKDEVMRRFSMHETDLLVSTTVVEVGVNVPNATVMLILNAERFGLSALHQLRGRIGRGEKQGYCIFMAGGSFNEVSKHTKERLDILGKSNDGFKIAEEDLKLRGPGDFFGLRQSGLPYFKIADIYSDAELLKRCKAVLEHMLRDEPKTLERLKAAVYEREDLSFKDFHGVCL